MVRDFKKLSDEEKLDLIADVFDPAAKIVSDPSVKKAYANGEGRAIDIFKAALKADHDSVIEILAAFAGVEKSSYVLNMVDPISVYADIVTNSELVSVFAYAGQLGGAKSSGSHTENTTENEI